MSDDTYAAWKEWRKMQAAKRQAAYRRALVYLLGGVSGLMLVRWLIVRIFMVSAAFAPKIRGAV